MEHNFNYDHIKFEFTPDGLQIRCTGTFFIGEFLTEEKSKTILAQLQEIQKTGKFVYESSEKLNAYFIGLIELSLEKFRTKEKLINNQ